MRLLKSYLPAIILVFFLFACGSNEPIRPDSVTWYLDGFPNKVYKRGDSIRFDVKVDASSIIQFVDINLSEDVENAFPLFEDEYFESAAPGENEVLIHVAWKLEDNLFDDYQGSDIVYISLVAKTKKIETRESTFFKIER